MSRIVVFVGPTISTVHCRTVLDATYLPPVAQGDVYRAAQQNPVAIGIIDGYFERVPAVWHKEILWAMKQGIHVYGASSMGALRAAELASFGMVGVGEVFEAFRDGLLEDDDEVTVVHSDAESGYLPVSAAMVDIRATLASALACSVISESTCARLLTISKSLFYPERSYPQMLKQAREEMLPAAELDALGRWLPAHAISQKRADALAMLHFIQKQHELPAARLAVTYHFEHTDMWEQVVNRSGLQTPSAHVHGLPPQTLLEELQLKRELYEHALTGAFERSLALAEADRQRLQVNATLAGEAVTALRRRHGLVEDDSLPRWIEEQELDLPAFRELVLREARVHWVHTVSGTEVARHLPDWLRVTGRYHDVAQRARDKQRWLRDNGLENPALTNAPLDEAALLHWFFVEQQGSQVPPRLDLHAHAVGFANSAAFLQAVLREYYYVTRPAEDASAAASE